ncbi:hypothetical protein CHLRE_10g422350v5 [Chlamydomonas reinhardtii]|uniref:Uncharacterized protein n=1 Tax=Chlamydomonas reinhardtii TaxID=3055 RepID=A0A2K3D999_CHLRE|nr:uncharacterized protein CHLRE_10g422350v5 [Chlamydomonas reinhardtii]PNW77106.1 hypothetical protein CHLRE_10g422350v5 [Chlamydomonas reinhardtii]
MTDCAWICSNECPSGSAYTGQYSGNNCYLPGKSQCQCCNKEDTIECAAYKQCIWAPDVPSPPPPGDRGGCSYDNYEAYVGRDQLDYTCEVSTPMTVTASVSSEAGDSLAIEVRSGSSCSGGTLQTTDRSSNPSLSYGPLSYGTFCVSVVCKNWIEACGNAVISISYSEALSPSPSQPSEPSAPPPPGDRGGCSYDNYEAYVGRDQLDYTCEVSTPMTVTVSVSSEAGDSLAIEVRSGSSCSGGTLQTTDGSSNPSLSYGPLSYGTFCVSVVCKNWIEACGNAVISISYSEALSPSPSQPSEPSAPPPPGDRGGCSYDNYEAYVGRDQLDYTCEVSTPMTVTASVSSEAGDSLAIEVRSGSSCSGGTLQTTDGSRNPSLSYGPLSYGTFCVSVVCKNWIEACGNAVISISYSEALSPSPSQPSEPSAPPPPGDRGGCSYDNYEAYVGRDQLDYTCEVSTPMTVTVSVSSEAGDSLAIEVRSGSSCSGGTLQTTDGSRNPSLSYGPLSYGTFCVSVVCKNWIEACGNAVISISYSEALSPSPSQPSEPSAPPPPGDRGGCSYDNYEAYVGRDQLDYTCEVSTPMTVTASVSSEAGDSLAIEVRSGSSCSGGTLQTTDGSSNPSLSYGPLSYGTFCVSVVCKNWIEACGNAVISISYSELPSPPPPRATHSPPPPRLLHSPPPPPPRSPSPPPHSPPPPPHSPPPPPPHSPSPPPPHSPPPPPPHSPPPPSPHSPPPPPPHSPPPPSPHSPPPPSPHSPPPPSPHSPPPPSPHSPPPPSPHSPPPPSQHSPPPPSPRSPSPPSMHSPPPPSTAGVTVIGSPLPTSSPPRASLPPPPLPLPPPSPSPAGFGAIGSPPLPAPTSPPRGNCTYDHYYVKSIGHYDKVNFICSNYPVGDAPLIEVVVTAESSVKDVLLIEFRSGSSCSGTSIAESSRSSHPSFSYSFVPRSTNNCLSLACKNTASGCKGAWISIDYRRPARSPPPKLSSSG